MVTPSVGPIGFSDINIELGSPSTTLRSLNDAAVRTLAGPSFATPGTTISFNDLRGKSNSLSATGGTVIDITGFRIHVFTSPGSFVVTSAGPGLVEYVVVAGGGSGGGTSFPNIYYGGGGAGGFRTGTNFPVTATTYPITVGGGGSPSIFSTITSNRGGGAAFSGTPGGSGSGGTYSTGGVVTYPGGSGNDPPVSPPQGNPGGSSATSGYPTPIVPLRSGGGGGGAGGAGRSAGGVPQPGFASGAGGIGAAVPWVPASYGTPGPAPGRYFAGGGGAGSNFGAYPGGFGGGGPGSGFGTLNTGGGNGGSGIVIIRYAV